MGIFEKVIKIFNPKTTREEEIAGALNNTELTSDWNAKRVEHARSLDAPVAGIMSRVKTKVKDVLGILWEAPLTIGRKILSAVNDLAFLPAAKLITAAKGKLIDAPIKLAISGSLVATTEVLEKADFPIKMINGTHAKIDSLINRK